MSSKIEAHNAVTGREVLNLPPPEVTVATPAVHEDQQGRVRHPRIPEPP